MPVDFHREPSRGGPMVEHPEDPDDDDVASSAEYRLTDALTDRLERALDMACAAAVFDRLQEIAILCDEAAAIARGWPAEIPAPVTRPG